jgi:ABC-type phosphate transport system permease subunit
MLVLSILACIAALLGLLWLAQNSPSWAGDAALYILLITKWAVIVAVALAVILGIAYAVYIQQ